MKLTKKNFHKKKNLHKKNKSRKHRNKYSRKTIGKKFKNLTVLIRSLVAYLLQLYPCKAQSAFL